MFNTKTLKLFLLILSLYALLWSPALFWPTYLDTLPGLIAAFPLLSIYLFHAIGIPGLLENNGACGWGWCAPTLTGWVVLVIFWLLVTWLVAAMVVHLKQKPGTDTQ